jgi:hypothetical protein
MMPWRRLSITLLLLGVVFVSGCGSNTGTLTGTVSLNGQPLTVGQVTAYSDNHEQVGFSAILPDGTYRMADVPAGPVILVVQTFTPEGQPMMAAGAVAPPVPPDNKLPPAAAKQIAEEELQHLPEETRKAILSAKAVPVPLKYTDSKQSDLKATVSRGTTTFNIEMTGKGQIPRPVPTGGPPPPPPLPGGPHPPPVP